MKKKIEVDKDIVTIEQLFELMPHLQAGRITRSDVQGLIEVAAKRELYRLRDDCLKKAHAAVSEIRVPDFVSYQMSTGVVKGHEHYIEIEAATYKKVRILTSLYAITEQIEFLASAYQTYKKVELYLHQYARAMILLRYAEASRGLDDYNEIAGLASSCSQNLLNRTTILCDLSLISGDRQYLTMAKSEVNESRDTGSHVDLSEEAIIYVERQWFGATPGKLAKLRDDIFFPKYTSYLLKNSEAGSLDNYRYVADLISNKESLQSKYEKCLNGSDEISRNIELFYIAVAYAICGEQQSARSIMNNHRFDPYSRDKMANFFAKTMLKNRRLTGSFASAVVISDPYLRADALLAIAKEIDSRLKK